MRYADGGSVETGVAAGYSQEVGSGGSGRSTSTSSFDVESNLSCKNCGIVDRALSIIWVVHSDKFFTLDSTTHMH